MKVATQVLDELSRFGKDFYIPEEIYLRKIKEISFRLKELFVSKKYTLCGAESVTGGKISSIITDIPGASEYFLGSIVSYSAEVKKKILSIKEDTIKNRGAVSKMVSEEMAKKSRKIFGSTFSYSTTGYAGPGGGDENNPIGTVYFGFDGEYGNYVWKAVFSGKREEIRNYACEFCIRSMYIFCLNISSNKEA